MNDIINCCWHPVTVKIEEEFYHWEKAPKSQVVRVEYRYDEKEKGFFERAPAKIVNMPRKINGLRYIVSEKALLAIKQLHPKRDDFIAPGIQNPDANQEVKYCLGFQV